MHKRQTMSFGLNGNFFAWVLQFYYMIQLIKIVIGKNYRGKAKYLIGVIFDPVLKSKLFGNWH